MKYESESENEGEAADNLESRKGMNRRRGGVQNMNEKERKRNSRKSVTWSAVPNASVLVYVGMR